MIQHATYPFNFFPNESKICEHAAGGVRSPLQRNFAMICVSVYPAATFRINLTMQCMCCFEVKFLTQFVSHRMPIILWVWTLKLHWGLSMQ